MTLVALSALSSTAAADTIDLQVSGSTLKVHMNASAPSSGQLGASVGRLDAQTLKIIKWDPANDFVLGRNCQDDPAPTYPDSVICHGNFKQIEARLGCTRLGLFDNSTELPSKLMGVTGRCSMENHTLIGGTGNDLIRGSTNTPNTIYGREGKDRIIGGNKADFLRGDQGADSIFGRYGVDEIHTGYFQAEPDGAIDRVNCAPDRTDIVGSEAIDKLLHCS